IVYVVDGPDLGSELHSADGALAVLGGEHGVKVFLRHAVLGLATVGHPLPAVRSVPSLALLDEGFPMLLEVRLLVLGHVFRVATVPSLDDGSLASPPLGIVL